MTRQERKQLQWREAQQRRRARKLKKSETTAQRIERIMQLACPKRKRYAA